MGKASVSGADEVTASGAPSGLEDSAAALSAEGPTGVGMATVSPGAGPPSSAEPGPTGEWDGRGDSDCEVGSTGEWDGRGDSGWEVGSVVAEWGAGEESGWEVGSGVGEGEGPGEGRGRAARAASTSGMRRPSSQARRSG